MGTIVRQPTIISVTVPNGQKNSNCFEVGQFSYGSVQMAQTITSSTCTLSVSNQTVDTWANNDGNLTLTSLTRSYDNGSGVITTNVLTLTVSSGLGIDLPPEVFKYNIAQLNMASNEGAARTNLVKLTG